ncbi:MAG: tetratricopeptide repeat protein [Candidatus Omnitrophota bacterium]
MVNLVKPHKGFIAAALTSRLSAAAVLFCLGLLVYSNSFLGPFHFDDLPSIMDNFAIRNISDPRNIWDFWPTRFFTYLSVALNYALGGYKVFGYHVFNFLAHTGASLLAWYLAILTFKTPALKNDPITAYAGPLAFFTGALFLVHPIQTQPVNYIIQRATLLAGFFYLGSLCFYAKARLMREEGLSSRAWAVYYGISLLAAILAMFSKENAVSLPAAICLYELCFLKSKKGFGWKYVIPFLAAALIVPLTMFFSRSIDFKGARRITEGGPVISAWHYFLTQMRVMVTYLRLLLVPVNQNLDYYYPAAKSIFQLPVILSLALLLLVLSFAVRVFNKYRLLSFGIFWFFITLLPESSLIPIYDVIFEHRLYLPMLGSSFFLVCALFYLLGLKKTGILFVILSLLVVGYSAMAYQRNKVWQSDLALWDDATRKSPAKVRSLVSRGLAYAKKDYFDLALADYDKALKINPKCEDAYNNRGLAYQNKGRPELALADYNKAIELNPDYAEAYNNRGTVYAGRRDFDLALADFIKAISIFPECADAYNNRAGVYANKGSLELALADYNKAIKINPNLAGVFYNRGLVYQNKGRPELALADYSRALELDPARADIYLNRGIAYAGKGDLDRAVADLSQAVEIDPGSAKAYYNRGLAYQNKDDFGLALADYNKAIELDSQYSEAYSNRIGVYCARRQYDKAWLEAHNAEALGLKVAPEILEYLKKASNRVK